MSYFKLIENKIMNNFITLTFLKNLLFLLSFQFLKMTNTEKKKDEYDPKALEDLLPIYYKRLFPHLTFYRWLSYGNCKFRLFIPEIRN